MFFRANELLRSSETSAKVQLLGDFHPNGPGLTIPDPETEKDPKAYETTYWLVWNFKFLWSYTFVPDLQIHERAHQAPES